MGSLLVCCLKECQVRFPSSVFLIISVRCQNRTPVILLTCAVIYKVAIVATFTLLGCDLEVT
ncbi:hypothetical protein PanWU01x14_130350 [Parasponia andersonii]|uniref:Uncharacterized protein n=1 Tax=Parasponia andersonii TaxID=3476 RepID=A0A2P5CRA3_PARAD|nr:hypothetical protein PanWU01x14_130350 [Parasponia andersonii]